MTFGRYARQVDKGPSKAEMRNLLLSCEISATVIPAETEVRKDMCESRWKRMGGRNIATNETSLAKTLRILDQISKGVD